MLKFNSFINLVVLLAFVNGEELSDLRQCCDELCESLISTARTTHKYNSIVNGVLSFNIDEPVEIYSKEAGRNPNLWGAKINGRFGYIPRKMVKEERIICKKHLEHTVPVLLPTKKSPVASPVKSNKADIPVDIITGSSNVRSSEILSKSIGNIVDENIIFDAEDVEYTTTEGLSNKDFNNTNVEINVNSNIKVDISHNFQANDDHPATTELPGHDKPSEFGEGGTTNKNSGINEKHENPVNAHSTLYHTDTPIHPGVFPNAEAGKNAVNSGGSYSTPQSNVQQSIKANQENIGSINQTKNIIDRNDEVYDDSKIDINVENNYPKENRDGDKDVIKEVDNEDESNGNGEENGNEQSINDGTNSYSEPNGENGSDSANVATDSSSVPNVDNSPSSIGVPDENSDTKLATSAPADPNLVGKEIVNDTPVPAPTVTNEKSDAKLASSAPVDSNLAGQARANDTPDPGITVPHEKSDEKLASRPPVDSNLTGKERVNTLVPAPTPKYEIIEGTTIYDTDSVTPTPSVAQYTNSLESSVEPPVTQIPVPTPYPSDSLNTHLLHDESVTDDPNEVEKNLNLSDNGASDSSNNGKFSVPKVESIIENKGEEGGFIQNMFSGLFPNGNEVTKPISAYESPSPQEDLNTSVGDDSQNSDELVENQNNLAEEVNEKLVAEYTNYTNDEENSADDKTADENYFSPTQEGQSNVEIGIKPEPPINNLFFVDPERQENNQVHEREVTSQSVPNVSGEESEHVHFQHLVKEGESEKNSVSYLKDHFLAITGAMLSEGMSLAIEGEVSDAYMTRGKFMFLLLIAFTIVILYLCHMMIVKMSREGPLLEMMNCLDRSHRILLEENNNFKQRGNGFPVKAQPSSHSDIAVLQKANQQVETMQKDFNAKLSELKERNDQLENDLEASTANEVELHKMLNELLSRQKQIENFQDSVNNLQNMLDCQQEVVQSRGADLALKSRLNDELKNELKSSKAKTSKLEYQIDQLTHSLEETSAHKQELSKRLSEGEKSSLSLKKSNESLLQTVQELTEESIRLSNESQVKSDDIKKFKKRLHAKEAECQVSKECLKKLQTYSDSSGNDAHVKLAEAFKIIEVKSKLIITEKEICNLKSDLDSKQDQLRDVQERLKNYENENSQQKDKLVSLQKERDEALAKLGVLTTYYEEKEAQLKKELESHEGLLQTAEGSAAVVSNRIQTYEVELKTCRSQIESLKKELEEQEQSYKIQLSNEERKLHDSWLSTRSAERRQEELRQENTQLRQRLTQMLKISECNSGIKHPSKRIDSNGSLPSPVPMENDGVLGLPLGLDGGPIPPPMMPPMFPGGRPPMPLGMPPPPMPPHLFGPLPPPPMPDRRLPPAGRMASPPGYDRRSYSPSSNHSSYSDRRYSPELTRYSPGNARGHSPDRPRVRNAHGRRPVHSRRSPSPHDDWYDHVSPPGYAKRGRSPVTIDSFECNNEMRRGTTNKDNKKTSTPLGTHER